MYKVRFALFMWWLSFFAFAAAPLGAQGSSGTGSIRGTVLDPSGAAIPGATIEIQNPVSAFSRSVQADAKGHFEIDNIPYARYHTTAKATGFQAETQDIEVRSQLPVEAKINLKLGAAATTVTVEGGEDLISTDSTTHTDIDRDLFEKLPLESRSSSLSSLVTLSTPGISADSNGLFHGLGDHASNSFSLDGQPITDQQSKVFSNQIPLDSVQSMEVIEGAPPAQYGDKTSTVIVVTTRSGLGATEPHGDITAGYGTFGSGNGGFDFLNGGKNWGNFISANGLDTSRFLDGPELNTMHDKGNEENFFDRADYKTSEANSFQLDLGFTRSWFQTPNSYDAEDATAWNGLVVSNGGLGPNGLPVGAQDQRSQIRTYNFAPAWTRLVNNHTVVTVGAFARKDEYNYYGSDNPFADFTPDLQEEAVDQARSLTNLGARASVTYSKGNNSLVVGGEFEHTLINENDSLGLVDPDANAVCLNADGSADTNPLLTNPMQCAGGGLTPNPSFVPTLACYDLTRTGNLPASDGCPTSSSGMYNFLGKADIREEALYAEDTLTLHNWTFNLGLRFDNYDGLTSAHQAEPRLGGSYNIKSTNTVLRASYARTMETPFNENLVLASEGCGNPVVSAFMGGTGTPCVTNTPLTPGTRDEFHVGLQQAFSRYFVLDGEYIWKYSDRAFDFSVLGDTPITFPIEWDKSKIPGYAIRGSMPELHGLTAFVVMSSVAARFFTPQVSGIGAAPLATGTSSEVFRIDHDETFNQTTHLQYQILKNGPWIGFNWRYDSGLVAGPVPCAGGDCANGPNGNATTVDVSELTPDQQFEAGLFCGTVHATPTTSISPNNLCPASEYGSTLLTIPAPGTENDDHNPPRVAPRNLFDMSVGDDNLFHSDRQKYSLQFSAINLTNKEAVYNFLSTFSGTHYVSPRTLSMTLGYHF